MVSHTCWYCVHAVREDRSNVRCDRDNQYHGRSASCVHWCEDWRKVNAGEEELGLY